MTGSVTLNSTTPLKGLYSADIPNASSAYLTENFTGVDDLYVSFYLRVNVLPGADVRLAQITNAGTTVGAIVLRATGALRLKNGSTTVGLDSTPLTEGALYRVGLHQKLGAGGNAILEAYLIAGDAAFGAPFASTTTGTWTTQADRFRFGATTGTLNATFDNIRLDSGSMPPAGAAPGRTQVTLARAPQTGGAFAHVISEDIISPAPRGNIGLAASVPMNGTVPSLLVNLSVAEPAPPADVLARPPAAPAFSTLMSDGTISTTITYEYDNLYRLTKATYSSGATFDYTYDAVGNRLSQINAFGTITSTYDITNRLVNVGTTPYQWDANGNLLNDGTSTYAYDAANRLTNVTQGANNYIFTYNGLRDRVQQTTNSVTTNYALDLNAGLTQVLADGTNTYLYGNGRIAQYAGTTPAYFLGDALGSVRQLANSSGQVTLARNYEPFGSTMSSTGAGNSVFQFTGEMRDPTGLTFLRARYLDTGQGRFLTRDTWDGDANQPLSFNKWLYSLSNPVNYTDPSGMITRQEAPDADRIWSDLWVNYGVQINKDWEETDYLAIVGYGRGGVPIYAKKCGAWALGSWRTLNELQLVYDAVTLLSQKMGGPAKLQSALGHPRLTRWSESITTSLAPPGWLSAHSDVVLTDDTFDQPGIIGEQYARYTVIHELAHVWDHRTGYKLSWLLQYSLHTLSFTSELGETWNPFASSEVPPGAQQGCTMEDIAKRKTGCGDKYTFPYALTYGGGGSLFEDLGWEDWAESVASYVYPDYHNSTGQTNLVPGGVREIYVRFQLEHIR